MKQRRKDGQGIRRFRRLHRTAFQKPDVRRAT